MYNIGLSIYCDIIYNRGEYLITEKYCGLEFRIKIKTKNTRNILKTPKPLIILEVLRNQKNSNIEISQINMAI